MNATLYTDGGARGNPGPAGIGFVLTISDKEKIYHRGYIGKATNNQAEYKALIAGMERAKAEGVDELTCYLDSELVVKQLAGEYKVKDAGLKPLHAQVCSLMGDFGKTDFSHVPRNENKEADALVNEALDIETKRK